MTFGKFGCKVDLNMNMKTPLFIKNSFFVVIYYLSSNLCALITKGGGGYLVGFRSPIFKFSKILGFNEFRSAHITGYRNVAGNCTDCVHLYETMR